ncbi:fasciclin domain-containing protein [Pontibacter chinhatensis]|uniref:Uncaracterized surface protein containing fasciclin (FAS1) repeats n=1 Tax=Pontibacter chinhatensis TaxID=1436961 RepID=A0A1I2ZJR9_9BACT|nr:fasciclin domain-containing protein [Pontibacter chinhatensis]SFH38087.1 Uncaracterized surface protein containing fasciclin (FAS1) repeats [Pontibacter chinhatensis]
MKTIRTLGCALALCGSVALVSCGGGTNDENAANEMQREAGTNLREEPGSRGTTPTTEGKQAGEGRDEARKPHPRIGDNVMTPSRKLMENISAHPDLTMFVGALRKAELVELLNGTGPYTVFAPVDSVFDAIPDRTLDDWMRPSNKQRLVTMLNNHIVTGKITAADLTNGATLKTVGGQQLSVTRKGNTIFVNGARVRQADIENQNGVLHLVEKLLAEEK